MSAEMGILAGLAIVMFVVAYISAQLEDTAFGMMRLFGFMIVLMLGITWFTAAFNIADSANLSNTKLTMNTGLQVNIWLFWISLIVILIRFLWVVFEELTDLLPDSLERRKRRF